MEDGYIALGAVAGIITLFLLFQAHKRDEREKEENKLEKKMIEKSFPVQEHSQPVKEKNRFFNLRNLGWVSFAVVMFLLLSRDNDTGIYTVNDLGLSAEKLEQDIDFRVAVLNFIEDECWVILNENHSSGYGRRIQCYK
tara:strand:- start:770 stop:1186 length:417 start_codon:yes stop_codon:yes gene_type:complete